MTLRVALLGVVLVGISVQSIAAYAQTYPSKPVRLIVPDGPGGPTDLRARQLGPKLSEALGQPVVVENRPGGSMVAGAEAASRAVADGHTLFVGTIVTHSLNPLLIKSLPYRPDEDFAPIAALTAAPLVLAINAQVPANTFAELIQLSKSRPGGLAYGLLGRGSQGHLLMEQINVKTGARFSLVPYKSTATYLQDLIGGHIPVAFHFWFAVGPHVKSGKLKALAVAAPRRLVVAPDVPTFAEAGFPGIEGAAWQGIFAPAGTPRSVIARLHTEIARILSMPEIRDPITQVGSEVPGGTPDEFAAFIRADRAKWKKVVDQTGVTAE